MQQNKNKQNKTKQTNQPPVRKGERPSVPPKENDKDIFAWCKQVATAVKPGSTLHSLCLSRGWPVYQGPEDNSHAFGAARRRQIQYLVCREITKEINTRLRVLPPAARKQNMRTLEYHVLVLFPGNELDATGLRAMLHLPKDVEVVFHGYRPSMQRMDRSRNRDVFGVLAPGLRVDMVVALDCLWYLSPAELYQITRQQLKPNTRFLANHMPLDVQDLGLYEEVYKAPLLRGVPAEIPEDPVEAKKYIRANNTLGTMNWFQDPGDTTQYKAGYGYILNHEGVPWLYSTASDLDGAYDQPVARHWLDVRNPVRNQGVLKGCFEMHWHRSLGDAENGGADGHILLTGVFIRLAELEASADSRVHIERTTAFNNRFVIANRGVVTGAALSLYGRAMRVTDYMKASMDTFKRNTLVAVKSHVSKRLLNSQNIPGYNGEGTLLATLTSATATHCLELVRRVEIRPTVAPPQDYLEAGTREFDLLGRPMGAFITQLSQPAQTKAESIMFVLRGVKSFFSECRDWYHDAGAYRPPPVEDVSNEPPMDRDELQDVVRPLISEMSVFLHTYHLVEGVWIKVKYTKQQLARLIKKGKAVPSMWNWMVRRANMGHWFATLHAYFQSHPNVAALADILWVVGSSLTTAFLEETLKRLPVWNTLATVVGLVMGAYEAVCTVMKYGVGWKDLAEAAIKIVAHVLLALIPFPIAVIIHALINVVSAYLARRYPSEWVESTHKDSLCHTFAQYSKAEAESYVEMEALDLDVEPHLGEPIRVAASLQATDDNRFDLLVEEVGAYALPSGYKGLERAVGVTREEELLEGEELNENLKDIAEGLEAAGDPPSGKGVALITDTSRSFLKPRGGFMGALQTTLQRLLKANRHAARSAAVDYAYEAVKQLDLYYHVWDVEDLIRFIDKQPRSRAWKQARTIEVLMFIDAANDTTYRPLFVKVDEILKTGKITLIGTKDLYGFNWRHAAKNRPIYPLRPGEYFEMIVAGPFKKLVGEQAYVIREGKFRVVYAFVEQPNDEAINDALAECFEMDATLAIISHGDDLTFVSRYGALDGDLVSADQTQGGLQSSIVELMIHFSGDDAAAIEMLAAHLDNMEDDIRAKGRDAADQGVELVIQGQRQTITGECATALKHILSVLPGCMLASFLFDSHMPGHDGAGCTSCRSCAAVDAHDEETTIKYIYDYLFAVQHALSLLGMELELPRVKFLPVARQLRPESWDGIHEWERLLNNEPPAKAYYEDPKNWPQAVGPFRAGQEAFVPGTFLGGAIVEADDFLYGQELVENKGWDYVWVSLSVIKAQFYPKNVFRFHRADNILHELSRWFYVCSRQLAGNPVTEYFLHAAFVAYKQSGSEEDLEVFYSTAYDYWLTHVAEWYKPIQSGRYTIAWNALERCLKSLGHGISYPFLSTDLIEEFESKLTVTDFDDLVRFTSSWEPLFVARFGSRPTERSEQANG
jgi:hypothetical protein